MVAHAGADYVAVTAFLSRPIVALVMLLLILSMVWHMRLGLQVVIEDYIHGHMAKLLALILNTFFALAVGTSSVLAILKLTLA
jgi:succinate dehydrogenase / fumarate reductase membrane anchor subunit